MNIFVTGASGFIGKHLLNEINLNTHRLFCIKTGNKKKLVKNKKNLEWVKGSLTSRYTKYLSKTDILIHLASVSTNHPYKNLEKCIQVNILDSLKLFNQAKKLGVKNFIIIGSAFEYGISSNSYNFIPENAPLLPTSTYAASKAAGFIVFNQWAIENNIKMKYFRLFQVYGEGENPRRLYPSLKRASLSGNDFYINSGNQIRDFTPVEFVVKEIIKELNFKKYKSKLPIIKNISSQNPLSVKKFTRFWWKKWKSKGNLYFKKSTYRVGEVKRCVAKIK